MDMSMTARQLPTFGIGYSLQTRFISIQRIFQNKQGYELRIEGDQTRNDHIQELDKSELNITFHVAAGIHYYGKSDLIFYKAPK
jgi:hypothetical protein